MDLRDIDLDDLDNGGLDGASGPPGSDGEFESSSPSTLGERHGDKVVAQAPEEDEQSESAPSDQPSSQSDSSDESIEERVQRLESLVQDLATLVTSLDKQMGNSDG